jgi:uncharacterized protein
MKTNINKSFVVNEPIDKVWASLSDPSQVVSSVPGASLTNQIDDDNFEGAVTLKFGPVKTSYKGKITFQERDAGNYKMVMKGAGTDTKGKGGADMLMTGILSSIDDGTEVNVNMEVTVTGMLAQFGSRLINDVSSSVFDQFVGNFKKQLAGEEVDNTMSAGSMIKGIFGK